MADNFVTEPVDLTNCDREPIHQLGRIQPFAWLLAFTADWTACRVSVNIDTLLGRTTEHVLGMPIAELFSEDAVHAIRGRCAVLGGSNGVERIFGLRLFEPQSSDRFDVALHLSDRVIVVEIEHHRKDSMGEASSMVRSMMARIDGADTLAAFLNSGARIVRAVTGFDRVMVYRFDRDGHGTVAAEARNPGVDSFLGLHYPASDIPRQARKLYLRSPFRIIADVAAEPVDILPHRNEFGEPLDLSLSISRAVSPIHIEYLRNMGIAASLSISIIVDNALWGLFACHHHSPLLPSFNSRSLSELFGQMFSLRLEGRLRRETMESERTARAIGDRLMAGIADDTELLADPKHISLSLQNIIPNDGIGTLTNGAYASIGDALPFDVVELLGKRLNAMEGGRVIVEEKIGDLLPAAAHYAHIAAGFMAIPLSRKPRDYVFLFRREQARTVSWAGNPEKPVTIGANGTRLTPRGSFDTWVEEVRGSCAPFSESELVVGELLRSVLTEVVLRIADAAQEHMRRQSDRQELLVAELNHRVRNILSLIRGLVRQSQGGSATVEEYIALLSGRIESLARAHEQITQQRWSPAPMRPLFEVEARAYLHGKAERISFNGPDLQLEPEAYATMALVVHELVTNSAKYGSLSDNGSVKVDWRVGDDGRLLIDWLEKDGPPVKAPLRRGFGSTIIERTIPHDLGGDARINYNVAGLEARFALPARLFRLDVQVRRATGLEVETGERPEDPSRSISMPGHVLLVEDSLIIALDAEEALLAQGVDRVSVASTVEQALAVLDRETVDAALLDLNLGTQLSLPVAEALSARAIPFAFATGYGDGINVGSEFAHVPVLQKPYGSEELSEILLQLV